MTTSLRCPTCSAPLDPPAPGARMVQCAYCGANAVLSERADGVEARAAGERRSEDLADVVRALREEGKIAAIKVYRERFGVGLKASKEAVERIAAGQPAGTVPSTTAQSGVLGCGCSVLFLVVLGAGLAVWLNTSGEALPPAVTDRVAALTPEAQGYAEEVLRFGREGTGAGRFEDARGVAVGGDGRIYLAEYQGGRVQVFDSLGTFLTQWMVDPERPTLDIDAASDGTVYVLQGGVVQRYEGATGRRLGDLPKYEGFGFYSELALALDGSLWALATPFTLVHLERDGAVLQAIDTRESVQRNAHPSVIAVAGDGSLYVADQVSDEIYRLDAQGRFVDRFAGDGDRPDQLRMPQALAFDGAGRLYVSDPGRGIRVYTPDGHFLDAFGGEYGVVFGLAIDDRDQLYAAFRNDHQIVKYQLPR